MRAAARGLWLAAALLWAAGAAGETAKPVVVELFTSQGCSSCPPADRILAELADREGVVALAFHVDYWDRLGWPDPFASRAATERQYAYAGALGRPNVYTPQMVVDGRHDVPGYDRRRLEAALAEAAAGAGERLAPRLAWLAPGRLRYALPAGEGRARVLLLRYARRLDQFVPRGENAGRQLAYHHVVRERSELPPWTGAAQEGERSVQIPPAEPGGLALLMQHPRTLRILGAARIEF